MAKGAGCELLAVSDPGWPPPSFTRESWKHQVTQEMASKEEMIQWMNFKMDKNKHRFFLVYFGTDWNIRMLEQTVHSYTGPVFIFLLSAIVLLPHFTVLCAFLTQVVADSTKIYLIYVFCESASEKMCLLPEVTHLLANWAKSGYSVGVVSVSCTIYRQG